MCSNWYLFADIWYYIHVHKKSKSFCLFLFFLLAAHEHEALENSDMSRKRHQGPTTVVDVLYIPVKYEFNNSYFVVCLYMHTNYGTPKITNKTMLDCNKK